MFPQMRSALGIDKSTDILEHIRSLPTEEDRTEAVAKVQAIEREAMLAQQPQPGLVDLMDYLEKRNIRRALCTRNFEYAKMIYIRSIFIICSSYAILRVFPFIEHL